MICYPFVFDHKGKRFMLYNGNSYGKTGFGLAEMEEDQIMKSVIIIGNSITAEVLYSLIRADERYNVECFAVDSEFITEDKCQGLSVVDIEDIPNLFDKSKIKII